MVPRRTGWAALVLLALALALPVPAGAAVRPVQLANHCFRIGALGRLYLKPTALGRYLLYDRSRRLVGSDGGRVGTPGPSTEWRFRRARGGRYRIRSTAPGHAVLAARPLPVRRARGCRGRVLPGRTGR